MTALDKAILAYRERPTEENKQRVLALQAAHTKAFLTSQADSFIERTR